jgi:plastocyanin
VVRSPSGALRAKEGVMKKAAIRTAAAAAALGLGLATAAWAGEVTVNVGHNKIDPAEVTIQAGDTVVFHNLDQMPGGHTVVADDGSFESPPLMKDEEWRHTFAKPGTHAIHIKQHPGAKGTITVE